MTNLTRLIPFLLIAAPCVASAQTIVQPTENGNVLSGYLRTLSSNPRNLAALLGAGEASLGGGDPNAALGFFRRAGEIDPRSARARAGEGSALVQLEQADEALRAFAEVMRLGGDEARFARDRGLAYDLQGDTTRAQRDYRLALTRGPDDETTRRLALSLGISGDRTQAMNLLDPLLRRKDQAAWRARAFVMAMTGDTPGAIEIARTVMPGSLAQSMTPFLMRLAALGPADRAHAVNFGTMPTGAQSYPPVQTASAGERLVPGGAPLGPRVGERVSVEPRRRPGTVAPVVARSAASTPFVAPPSTRVGQRVGVRIAAVDPLKLPPEARDERVVAAVAQRSTSAPPPVIAAPAVTGPPVEETSKPLFEVPTGPRVASAPVVATSRLASILAGIEPEAETPAVVPTIDALRAARLASAKKAAAQAKIAAETKTKADALAAEREVARRNPARSWVQIATGGNEAGLPLTWRKLRDGHAKLLKTQSAWVAPFKATNRLLVGPMKGAGDARTLVNALAKDGLSATTYASEAGEEVAKIGGK